ncbi:group II intron reverse transcriptase/maturase [Streptomyces sp. NPDC002738]
MDDTPGASTLNGPDGESDDASFWSNIDWKMEYRSVEKLRQRIFSAAKNGNLKQVRNLQKLMLRSRANTLTSVRRVAQMSSGRRTAGVDGVVALTPSDRGQLAKRLLTDPAATASPVRRVYIPKANGKTRPLGIPVLQDRANQARVKNALEPEWEARFEGRSYGFRPGRSCHDAIEAIFKVTAQKKAKRLVALDADLTAAFDRISHEHLLNAIGSFPGRRQIRKWLKAGVLEQGSLIRAEEGTPQGGVISPLLLNVALHGMGEVIGANRPQGGSRPHSPALIRYADDFVVLCATEEEAWEIKAKLTNWLAPRGLTFNEEKTQVRNLSEGFDFLGFNVRRYRDKLIIKPSESAVRRARARIKEIVSAGSGLPPEVLIYNLRPFVRGWSTYYRHAVSAVTFKKLDTYTYECLRRWACRRHKNKTGLWVAQRYWGPYRKGRSARWVFGTPEHHLPLFAWTRIIRYVPVKGESCKDDPKLVEYWAARARKRIPGTERKIVLSLAARQKGLCPKCGTDLIEGAEYDPRDVHDWVQWFSANCRGIHVHHIVHRSSGGSDHLGNLEVVHATCHRLHHAGDRKMGLY